MIYRVFAPCVLNLIRPTNLGIKFNTDVSRGCARIKFNTIRIKFNTDDSIQGAALRTVGGRAPKTATARIEPRARGLRGRGREASRTATTGAGVRGLRRRARGPRGLRRRARGSRDCEDECEGLEDCGDEREGLGTAATRARASTTMSDRPLPRRRKRTKRRARKC